MSRIFSSSLFCSSKMIDSGLTRIICGTWLDEDGVSATKHFFRLVWKTPFLKRVPPPPLQKIYEFSKDVHLWEFLHRNNENCAFFKEWRLFLEKWCIFTTKIYRAQAKSDRSWQIMKKRFKKFGYLFHSDFLSLIRKIRHENSKSDFCGIRRRKFKPTKIHDVFF